MSKSDAYENDILKLFFNATPIPNIADNATTSANTNLYIALHTADPTDAGDQSTSECAYTGYARVAVARTSAGWTVTGNVVNPTAHIDFPMCTAGSESATHFSVGLSSIGATKAAYIGTLTPNIAISNGVTPRVANTSTITED